MYLKCPICNRFILTYHKVDDYDNVKVHTGICSLTMHYYLKGKNAILKK